jgi:hypothetical protein
MTKVQYRYQFYLLCFKCVAFQQVIGSGVDPTSQILNFRSLPLTMRFPRNTSKALKKYLIHLSKKLHKFKKNRKSGISLDSY